MILGMDPWVFAAWIGTILATGMCVAYGLYFEYIKKKPSPTDKEADDKEMT